MANAPLAPSTSAACDIDPGAYTPEIMMLLEFNLWSGNSRVFPGIDPLVVRKNDKHLAARIGVLEVPSQLVSPLVRASRETVRCSGMLMTTRHRRA